MPHRRLAARVLGMVGINVVVEQRAPAIMRLALRALTAKRRDPRRNPVPGDRQHEPLGAAVILSGRHMLLRQSGAKQIRS